MKLCNVLQSLPHRLCLEADCVSPMCFRNPAGAGGWVFDSPDPVFKCNDLRCVFTPASVHTSGTYYPS